jgi:hypothetical protein
MDLGLTPERRYVSTLRQRRVRGGEAVDWLAADDLRRMIWRYFVMLIGGGALLKWIVPSLGAPFACNSRSSRPPNLLASCPLRAVPVNGPVVAYFLLLSSFTLLGLFQMCAVGQLDSVRSAKNVQPI